jgi:hypothetical protein
MTNDNDAKPEEHSGDYAYAMELLREFLFSFHVEHDGNPTELGLEALTPEALASLEADLNQAALDVGKLRLAIKENIRKRTDDMKRQ